MQNLASDKVFHAAEMRDSSLQGTFAVVDLTRDPGCEFGEVGRVDNRSPCLTASNHALWVFALGFAPANCDDIEMLDVPLPVDRWLHPCERALLQGFPPDMHINVEDAVRVFGNAMSVPTVGLLMLPVLKIMMPEFLIC